MSAAASVRLISDMKMSRILCRSALRLSDLDRSERNVSSPPNLKSLLTSGGERTSEHLT